ncbi:hypothetical protein ABXV23_08550 [Vibrio owensii]|uniref:hypothetical protein n=1 Tax=Vibrio owensii TaxID=696485 RepID=UPI00339AD8E1
MASTSAQSKIGKKGKNAQQQTITINAITENRIKDAVIAFDNTFSKFSFGLLNGCSSKLEVNSERGKPRYKAVIRSVTSRKSKSSLTKIIGKLTSFSGRFLRHHLLSLNLANTYNVLKLKTYRGLYSISMCGDFSLQKEWHLPFHAN